MRHLITVLTVLATFVTLTHNGFAAKLSKLTLTSNIEGTIFKWRAIGDNDWKQLGIGKIITTPQPSSFPCEIAAKPPGYLEKNHVLNEPFKEIFFTFMIGEKEPENPDPPPPPFRTNPEASFVNRKIGERWAVLIGISNYKDTRIPSLRYGAQDAKSFYDWLVSSSGGKYSPERVTLLIEAEATAANIKNALFNWLGKALEEDMVTVYFAGHGSPKSPDEAKNMFLLCHDTTYDNIAATGFPMWDIETALKRFIKARKVVVLADACHSGGIGEAFQIARRGNIVLNPVTTSLQDLVSINDGTCVISASDEKQTSQESEKWGGGHGVFTHFLLEGLKGAAALDRNKAVTLGELTQYLSQNVRRETRSAQSPVVTGKYDPNMTIGK